MRYDAVVVGNGPAGCISAEHGSSAGEVAIVGKKDREVECAGLISRTGLQRLGVKPGDFVLNKIRGARIFSPGGVVIEVDGRGTKAYSVDRAAFDEHLLHRAVDAGARYYDDWATSLKGGVNLKSGRRLEADRIVVATGTDYSLQKRHGLDRPREFLIGGQYEMKVECDRDFVELYFTVPDFFAWVIPLNDRVRVGLCVKTNPRPHLNSFVKELKSQGRIKSDKILAESFGAIPLHDPKVRTQQGNVVTVGDAAGQVKATTGGGIVFGGIAAQHACESDYERLWRREIGYDLRLHLLMHRTLNRLSDKGKDRLFSIVAECNTQLEKKGDMDYATKTLTGMLKEPAFILKTALNLPWLLADLL